MVREVKENLVRVFLTPPISPSPADYGLKIRTGRPTDVGMWSLGSIVWSCEERRKVNSESANVGVN